VAEAAVAQAASARSVQDGAPGRHLDAGCTVGRASTAQEVLAQGWKKKVSVAGSSTGGGG